MKNYLFTIAAVSLCLLTVPSWAMNDDADVPLNKATRLAMRPVAAPAVTTGEDADDSKTDTSQPEDKKSKTFFVFIAHQDAARLYEHFQEKKFFEGKSDSRTDELVNRDKDMRELCTTMKSALGKFDARQKLIHTLSGGKIIELTTREEQSVKTVVDHLKEPVFVETIFLDRAIVSRYRPTIPGSSLFAAMAASMAGDVRRTTGRQDICYEYHIEQLLEGKTHPTTDTASNSAQTEDRSSVGRDGDGSK